uniref:Uncharacterized protein n=1 Tax=Arundo donax TaxID=35708 RepID=A0A0A9A783_ARUDO
MAASSTNQGSSSPVLPALDIYLYAQIISVTVRAIIARTVKIAAAIAEAARPGRSRGSLL